MCLGNLDLGFLFQSTPSVWRETKAADPRLPGCAISIHSLRVEGDTLGAVCLTLIAFQSTPSVWRETFCFCSEYTPKRFQSTPSVWRETLLITAGSQCLVISIHSLRVEGDHALHLRQSRRLHFNPLPPCGGRLNARTSPESASVFQSTPSVWRETQSPT